jgi:hypothetical protein
MHSDRIRRFVNRTKPEARAAIGRSSLMIIAKA